MTRPFQADRLRHQLAAITLLNAGLSREVALNLLSDPFFTVVRGDESQSRVGLADLSDPDIRDVFAVRPDFRGALYQFLIATLQLALRPKNTNEWLKLFRQPPDAEQLRSALAPYVHAFALTSEKGPAFMQDADLLSEASPVPIAGLLIDAPGENTVKKNLDHFVHRDGVHAICPRCAALALFTLQINAPSGGQGHRVSVRGGGPLTTLVLPRDVSASLWQKLWLNVLPADELGYAPIDSLPKVLPWLAPTRTSDPKGAGDTVPDDAAHVHPEQVYWSMPRRIRLDTNARIAGQCGLCGEAHEALFTQYRTRNYGVNYTGAWMHPLTPYVLDPKNVPLSIKGQKGGIAYRQWLGLAMGTADAKPKAAQVVLHLNKKLGLLGPERRQIAGGLWCFGYDMDNMKARCWYDSRLPWHAIEHDQQRHVFMAIKYIIDSAVAAADLLTEYVKKARFSSTGKRDTDPAIALSFWQGTEAHFYNVLALLAEADFSNDLAVATLYRQWLTDLRRSTLGLFDQWVQSVPIEDGDIERVVVQQAELFKWLHASKAMKPLRDIVNSQFRDAV